MRFFSTISLAVAALTAFASAQTPTGAAPPVVSGMRGNAITSPGITDTVEAGQTYTIEWTNRVGTSVTLVLQDGGANTLTTVDTIATNIPNSGSYVWTVPATLEKRNTYTIRISYDNNPANYNYSDRFLLDSSVVASAAASASTATSAPASTSSAASSTEESTTAAPTTSSAVTSRPASNSTTMATTSRSSSTSEGVPTASSQGAPTNAASSTLSSPIAVIMALLAAAIFIH
ncbi:hypothetical protein DRE_04742 [Drechslerella stenobrocha 248]|uniref:Yeast cell wall synthesis Kre9/Knh1-like N-terminal domain-containing protein n=1 Tax=Drechslerella stenobrocha 248 TaxID=1043628 RepID=W7HRY2_9PEZI|nr:hypothetical protein DRE_04742 [Drechslerella stenobrocha 248]